MAMSIVLHVWWLFARPAIEIGFLMLMREAESTPIPPSALSCLHIFRNHWFEKPHNGSSHIVVQPLTSGFMSSKASLFWKPSSVSFLSVYIKFWHFFNIVSVLLWKFSEASAGFSPIWMYWYLPTLVENSFWNMVKSPETLPFFVYGRSLDSFCKELIDSAFLWLNQKMGKAPSLSFCLFSSNSVPRIVIWVQHVLIQERDILANFFLNCVFFHLTLCMWSLLFIYSK